MTTKEIADRLVALCKEGKNDQVLEELYSDDIVSVEAMDPPEGGMGRELRGIEAIHAKNAWWYENNEWHGGEIFGPYPHGDDRFAVRFTMDVTYKPDGQRFQMDEIAVYTVQDGKIVREEFFYGME